MEQTLALVLMALVIGVSQPSHSQEGAHSAAQTAERSASLDDRFEKCISDTKCALQERMRIMAELDEDLRQSLQRIDRNCTILGYNECVVPQRDEMAHWRKTQSHMAQMMSSMEMRNLSAKETPAQKTQTGEELSKTEPSAGEEIRPAKKPRWWQRR